MRTLYSYSNKLYVGEIIPVFVIFLSILTYTFEQAQMLSVDRLHIYIELCVCVGGGGGGGGGGGQVLI